MGTSVSLQIISKDRTGLINEISGIISGLNITILNHNARVYNNRKKEMISDFKVAIRTDNYKTIELLVRKLKNIKGVIVVKLS
ncbi:MAG: ACT domain-containing protein [Porcipelethomonas sp.]